MSEDDKPTKTGYGVYNLPESHVKKYLRQSKTADERAVWRGMLRDRTRTHTRRAVKVSK